MDSSLHKDLEFFVKLGAYNAYVLVLAFVSLIAC